MKKLCIKAKKKRLVVEFLINIEIKKIRRMGIKRGGMGLLGLKFSRKNSGGKNENKRNLIGKKINVDFT